MYCWRKLTPELSELVLTERQRRRYPWHRPPHFKGEGNYLISAACYEHRPFIGFSSQRMLEFEEKLLSVVAMSENSIFAWCVLPNHYHVLLHTPNLAALTYEIGQLHGRSSHQWNDEENTRGRKVWHAGMDRAMRSRDHFWATMNYVHHNPVKHGYVSKWLEWPFSSAGAFLSRYEQEDVIRIWREYPLKDYGKGWDDV